MERPTTLILRCECADAKTCPPGTRERLDACLAPHQDAVIVVDDLCGLAVRDPDSLAILESAERVIVIACRPRAVRALLARAVPDLDAERVHVVDSREAGAPERLRNLLDGAPVAGDAARLSGLGGEWRPWYPVLDRQRCVDCGICLDFCLFGVYERDDAGRVVVAHPQNCKYGCPACARLCPRQAVIFPKHTEGPTDGTEPAEREERATAGNMTADELYDLLKSRRQDRKRRLIRQEVWDEALKQRADCKGRCKE